ncbi:MAG: SAM-dependent methyltransferase [Desulfurococcales archaeon ex4484_58]|nr:MAG: SAM-dependent methyltransferase [Desulfurococcales archaeon ex4484_58]
MSHYSSISGREENDSVAKYDVTSSSYDQLYREEQFLKYKYVFLEKKLPLGKIILDVGCGTGLLIEFLDEYGLDKYEKYICVEPSFSMLNLLMEKNIIDHRILLVIGYGEYLPIIDNSVDNVFLFTVWDNVVDKEKLLNEVLRVVKPGGYVLISSLKKVNNIKPNMLLEGFKCLGCVIDCFYIYAKS